MADMVAPIGDNQVEDYLNPIATHRVAMTRQKRLWWQSAAEWHSARLPNVARNGLHVKPLHSVSASRSNRVDLLAEMAPLHCGNSPLSVPPLSRSVLELQVLTAEMQVTIKMLRPIKVVFLGAGSGWQWACL